MISILTQSKGFLQNTYLKKNDNKLLHKELFKITQKSKSFRFQGYIIETTTLNIYHM